MSSEPQGMWELLRAEAKKQQRYHGGTAPGRRKTVPPNSEEVSKSRHSRETAARVAKIFGSNRTYVYQMRQYMREWPELYEHLEAGHLSIPQAARLYKLPWPLRDEFMEYLDKRGWRREVVREVFHTKLDMVALRVYENAGQYGEAVETDG